MKIICDIGHPAHVNFFKSSLKVLSENGNVVTIISTDRGMLREIIDRELGDYEIHVMGKHRGSILSIVFEANIAKFLKLLLFLLRSKFDIGISVGSFALGLASKILGRPNLQFDDDPERKLNVFLEKLTSSELFFPPIIEAHSKVSTFNALKEWAYLSPGYFSPEADKLREYDVCPYQYFFVREISPRSLNYSRQYPGIISSFACELPSSYKVMLSLEDKNIAAKYPSDWILLEEPLHDIHSLMYYSRVVISSGDSIAREGALLGVPSIYCGQRKMEANQMLCKKGMLFVKEPREVPVCINEIIARKFRVDAQDEFRHELMDEWEDVTAFIVKAIETYVKENQSGNFHNAT